MPEFLFFLGFVMLSFSEKVIHFSNCWIIPIRLSLGPFYPFRLFLAKRVRCFSSSDILPNFTGGIIVFCRAYQSKSSIDLNVIVLAAFLFTPFFSAILALSLFTGQASFSLSFGNLIHLNHYVAKTLFNNEQFTVPEAFMTINGKG